MTRAQWALVAFVGVVALVAFDRTETIAQRLGMSPVFKRRAASGII